MSLEGKSLKFMKTYTRKSNSNGKFSIPINLEKGDYLVTVNYGGDLEHAPSSKNVILHVN